MDDQEKQVLDNIEKFGCHILHIMEEGDLPCFTYSVGINKSQKQPDLILYGLKREISHWIVNNYYERLSNGERFKAGKFYSDFIEGHDVCFEKVAKKHYEEHFGWNLWLHKGNEFEALQLIWPTVEGVWPWAEQKSDYYEWAQPILNETGALEEV